MRARASSGTARSWPIGDSREDLGPATTLHSRTARRSRGSPAFRWSGCGSERPATRSLDPPRSPRPEAGTTNAPTAPRNREHSRARTRRCRRAREASRPRNQCGAYRDSRGRRRSVKSCRNLSLTAADRLDRCSDGSETASTRTTASILPGASVPATASATQGSRGSAAAGRRGAAQSDSPDSARRARSQGPARTGFPRSPDRSPTATRNG